MSTKKSNNEIILTDIGMVRVEWASNNKTRTRRVDQKPIDRYMLSGKVTELQHQAANWYFNLATVAQATPNMVSQMSKINVGKGKPVISNKQAEARIVLNKVEAFVKEATSPDALSVMRNVVVYDESMREQQRKYGGSVRKHGILMLQDALNAVDKIMGKYSRWV